MIRRLLAATALTAVMASGAFAQTATTATGTDAAATAPASGTMAPAKGAMAPAGSAMGLIAHDSLASNLIGTDIYNGAGSDADNIGEVKDLVIGTDGRVAAVVVSVGGFLGIGDRNVALPLSDLSTAAGNGDRWVVSSLSKDALKSLPAFDSASYQTAANAPAATATGTAATGTMATDTMAAAPATTDATSTSAIDKSALTNVQSDQITSESLVGTTVYGSNDQRIGKIGDVAMTTDGKVDAIVIDVGGFLGIGSKSVAVGMDKLSFLQDGSGNRYLYTTFTKEQLEAQPAFDASTYSENRDSQRLILR